jgi:phosphoglycerate dehydrogenase-like enzyme
MKIAAFVGNPSLLTSVYTPGVREEISRCYLANPRDILGADWVSQASELSDADVIFATWGMPKLDAAFLAAAPRVRAVFYAAGSVKRFSTPEAERAGITICSAFEANGIPVAEYSLAVILLSLKGFWSFQRQPSADKFRREVAIIRGAYGSTVGLVALGSIGARLARLLHAHEVNLLAYDPFLAPATASRLKVASSSLTELFACSDVVSVHAPWLPATEKMIGADLMRSMKRGATLVNTSRGAVIDEEALCAVLLERPDLTAILDVTHPEPPALDSPLRHLPNVILTPHVAGSIGPEVERMGWWMAEEARRWILGEPLHHQVTYQSLERTA